MSAFIPTAIGAGTSLISGLFNRNKKSKIQRKQSKLIDQLIEGVSGRGSLSPLFNLSDDQFQKRFIDPAKNRFKNQIAPQIQQNYIQSGQQNSTGLEDALTRAGVDLDDAIESSYAGLRQNMNANALSAVTTALSASPGKPKYSALQRGLAGLQGYTSSQAFPKSLDLILENYSRGRKGFEKGGVQ